MRYNNLSNRPQDWMKTNILTPNFNHKNATRLLKVLLSLDILFILGHAVIAVFLDFKYKSFLVVTDGGYPEIFQYLKYGILMLLTSRLIFQKHKIIYFPWLFLFFLLFIDDAYRLHEKSGRFLEGLLGLTEIYGLRPNDFGELIYASLVGLVFFGTLFLSYYKGSKTNKKTCLDILLLFLVFLFFGIGIDMFHQIVVDFYRVSVVVALIEDGGEMIAISFMVWYFYFINFSTVPQTKYLHEYLFKVD